MAMADESDGVLEMCIMMTTSPALATLAKQVNLTLFTVSGTGKITIYKDILK